MIYLIIYLSIGLGVYIGLCSLRITQDKANGVTIGDSKRPYTKRQIMVSYLLGFVGGLLAWPLLIFHLEP